MASKGRDIAGGKHEGMRDRLQSVADGDEPLLVRGQAGLEQPGRRRRVRYPDRGVKKDIFLGLTLERIRRDGHDLPVEVQFDGAFANHAGQAPTHAGTMRRQQLGRIRDDCELDPWLALQVSGNAVLQGQANFRAAGAAADDRDAERACAALQQRLLDGLPTGHEPIDRLDRQGVVGRSRHILPGRRRSDIE